MDNFGRGLSILVRLGGLVSLVVAAGSLFGMWAVVFDLGFRDSAPTPGYLSHDIHEFYLAMGLGIGTCLILGIVDLRTGHWVLAVLNAILVVGLATSALLVHPDPNTATDPPRSSSTTPPVHYQCYSGYTGVENCPGG